jgi:hypothetical protein
LEIFTDIFTSQDRRKSLCRKGAQPSVSHIHVTVTDSLPRMANIEKQRFCP